MNITIEPETDEEKAQPQVKRVVMAGMAAVAIVGINFEQPEHTPIYFHAPNLPTANISMLQQRVAELEFQLLKARFMSEAAQAKHQQPLIQVAQPTIPFPKGNDRLRL